MIENYICTYFKPSFWASGEPNWQLLKEGKISLNELVGEEIFSEPSSGIYIYRDGLIALKISKLYELYEKHIKKRGKNSFIESEYFTAFCIDYSNSICLLLESEYIKYYNHTIFRLSKIRELFVQSYDDSKRQFRETVSLGHDDLGYFRSELYKRKMAPDFETSVELRNGNMLPFEKWVDEIQYGQFQSNTRIVIKNEILESFKQCTLLLTNNLKWIAILSMLSSALDSFRYKLYSETIINAWSIIEYFINQDWDNLIYDYKSKGKMNGARQEIMEGRDYSASIKSNILEMNGFLSFDDYQKMNRIRRARNSIAHDFSYSTYNNKLGDSDTLFAICSIAFELIQTYIEKAVSLQLKLNTSVASIVLMPNRVEE